MCDPLTIAGIALTAGSTVANTMAQNKVAKARSDAMSAERIRQQGLDQEAQALNTASQNRYGPDYAKGQQKTGQQLGDMLAKQDISTDTNIGGVAEGPPSTSDVTVQETNKQQANAKAYTQKQGQARGQLMSFGDYLGGTSRLQARDAGLIGQIGGFERGSANVLPYELDSASHKGDSLNMLGDLLNFGGSLALGKGLQNPDWNPAAASSAVGGVNVGAGPWGASLTPAASTVASVYPKVTRSGRYLGLGGLYGGSA